MASLAQVAGQYVFLLFNANGIGTNPTSGWVLLAGVIWIILMTAICYVGIEVSANFQKILLSIEIIMLLVLSIVALVKVGNRPRASRLSARERELVQPVQGEPVLVHRRARPVPVHLLGLGHRGGGQRGDQGPQQDPGPGRHHLDRHPADHLRCW